MSTSKYIRAFHPLFFFHLAFLFLVIVNFPIGKYFVGWDALNPEFNFPLNFMRGLFGAWQENYGLGLIGGHGFAATLPHTLLTWASSFALPQEAIRPAFTFLCLYLGGTGMYILVKKILNGYREFSLSRLKFSLLIEYASWISLFSSLFYVLNLGTIQIFYAQLETFIAHFAALPWLFWITLCVLEKKTRRNLFLFFVINFFATLQGFIPSLFVAYALSLGIFLLVYVVSHRSLEALKKAAFIVLLTALMNAYWLLPLGYYQITKGGEFIASYNNLSSTSHFIDINKKYGDLANVALLKGYLFDSFQLGDHILAPWIMHQNNIIVLSLGYFYFLLVVLGALAMIVSKNWVMRAFSLIFLFFFINIATNTVPFSYIIAFLHHLSPTFEQAFRTAFTKFGIGLSFSYSVLIGVGLLVALSGASRFVKQQGKIVALYISFLVLFLYYALPAFSGSLFYTKLLITIPQAYFEVMDYFKTQGDGRIADFPQECSEGWYAYKWGYFGSGFYWYGIKQPILARSFDVWSKHNENYYWQITQALRAQDFEKLDSLFEKYQAKWILYDPNLFYCRDQKGVFIHTEWLEYLKDSPKYTLVKTFQSDTIQPILLYVRNNSTDKSFISLKSVPENTGPVYTWTDNDASYGELSDYITDSSRPFAWYYPFQTLFSKRGYDKQNFDTEVSDKWIIFKTQLAKNLSDYSVSFKKYRLLEKSIPVEITTTDLGKTQEINFEVLFPQIYLDSVKLTNFDTKFSLGEIDEDLDTLHIYVNGEEVKEKNGKVRAIFYFDIANQIEILNSAGTTLFEWNSESDPSYGTLMNDEYTLSIPAYTQGVLAVAVPKITDNKIYGIEIKNGLDKITPQPCNQAAVGLNQYEVGKDGKTEFIRLISQDSSQCIFLHVKDALTSFSYLVEVSTRNIEGNKPKFSILNKDRSVHTPVTINSTSSFQSSYFILPQSFSNELGYDIQFENMSENSDTAINDFGGINMWHIPYEFIRSITLEAQTHTSPIPEVINSFSVAHPSETQYSVSGARRNQDTLLLLSQTFDPGWKAYTIESKTQKEAVESSFIPGFIQDRFIDYFPFLFGKEVTRHVLVNNWSNGWIINASRSGDETMQVKIVYWPQYLEWIGFLCMFLFLDSILDPLKMLRNTLKKQIKKRFEKKIQPVEASIPSSNNLI